jgi:hypothetical protein
MKNFNQDHILNYKPIDYKDTELISYTLKINSKDRNIVREPNPFNFEIIFNQEQTNTQQKALIQSKFENIKKISLCQLIIPRYIPRDFVGEPFTGITPIYNSTDSISLSYYPGININNSVIPVLDISGNEQKIEVIELVDLANKKMYLIALQYNNPYYLTKYINIKAELLSYLNINNVIYPITNIIGNIITLGNTDVNPLPINTNYRLIAADFYKNCVMVDTNGTKIGINSTSILIINANIMNYQYVYKDQYLEYQVNSSIPNIYERKLFKISSIYTDISNNLTFNGTWVNGLPSDYNNTNPYFFNTKAIRLNQFNFGVRDLFEEKMFYLNLSPFVPSKSVSTDPNLNNSFGVLYPSTPNSTKDYLYLKGDATETYTFVNLQTTKNKIQFSLMDSNNQLIGTIYNKYFNLYKPNNDVALSSYLPFLPDVNIILKIEEVDKKFNNLG